MTAARTHKLNCWESLKCGQGIDSAQPCPAATDTSSNDINGGHNAGRLCWAVVGTLAGTEQLATCAQETPCASCDFLNLVKAEEGQSFQLLKLARGVINPRQLHQTISQVESLMAIHKRLHSHFDLDTTIREITEQASKVTGAQQSAVLLLRGKPLALHGELILKGKPNKVVINIDETSATGYAALHDQMVNLRNIYDPHPPNQVFVFNRAFDEQCGCRTHSLLAVPIHDSEERVIGVITTANAEKGFFSPDDEWFMENYATEVAMAVEKQKAIQQTISALRLASIGETVAALSHCIKNIAQALRTGSHVIKRAIRSGKIKDVKAAWKILDRHIERLADLSMDILAYDPMVKEYSEKRSLNKLVERVLDLFKEEARARAVEVRYRKGKNVDPAKFDPMGIYRCLVNLISNALDACPLSDGAITVSTKRTGETEFVIAVADNGPGMDEKTKASLFELFQTSKPCTGTGLGLPTVADIADRHHGRVEIDSEPGKGTTFRLFIREDVAVV